MSLLRIFGLGGKKRSDEEPLDGLSLAREEMLNRMRSRMEGISTDPAVPLAEPYAEPPLPGAGQQYEQPPQQAADPLAGLQADAAAASQAGESAEGPSDGAAGGGTSDLGSDLLDVFRDAKEETEEGSLASELEDVSIGDLLGDIRGISSRLGVKAERREEPVEQPVPEISDLDVELEDETPDADPELFVQPPANLRQVQFQDEDEDGAEQAGPEMSAAPDYAEEYDDPRYGEPRGSAGQRYVLHALFLSLALTLGAGLGIRTAQGGTLAADIEGAPAVLAYLNPPIVPPEPAPVESDSPELRSLQKDTRAAVPSPPPAPPASPAPAPTPDPQTYGFIAGQPAWMVYAIQSGDSLSSIAEAFSICPDHILWNNPSREEEDRLIVGDEMLLPGYAGVVYRMQSGETLADVAARYSTTVDKVLAYPGNGLTGADQATPGTVVLLPDAIPPSALLQDAEARWAYTNPSDYGYVWPFYGPITTYYGEERPGYVHNAIDIGGLGHFGAPVLATAEGRVDKVEDLYNGLGRYTVISHPDGSRSVYGHMSDVFVEPGDYVFQGQPVGALGCTGHSTGTHLHFELWINGGPVDPLAYLP